MLITLSEPVWPMASLGFVIAAFRAFRKDIKWQTLLPTLFWFAIPFGYVLLRRPPMYDGFRHFLFIVPPIFVLGGIALDAIFNWLKRVWLQAALMIALVLPGVIPGIHLHPYEYTYYNQFVGGTGKAAQRYETDYWLTCYKEAVEQLGRAIHEPVNLYVRREFYIAAYYAPENVSVFDYKNKKIQPGDYVLYHSRAFPNLQRYADTNEYFQRVERDGAIFCEIRKR